MVPPRHPPVSSAATKAYAKVDAKPGARIGFWTGYGRSGAAVKHEVWTAALSGVLHPQIVDVLHRLRHPLAEARRIEEPVHLLLVGVRRLVRQESAHFRGRQRTGYTWLRTLLTARRDDSYGRARREMDEAMSTANVIVCRAGSVAFRFA